MKKTTRKDVVEIYKISTEAEDDSDRLYTIMTAQLVALDILIDIREAIEEGTKATNALQASDNASKPMNIHKTMKGTEKAEVGTGGYGTVTST